jgi:hypothetical protein
LIPGRDKDFDFLLLDGELLFLLGELLLFLVDFIIEASSLSYFTLSLILGDNPACEYALAIELLLSLFLLNRNEPGSYSVRLFLLAKYLEFSLIMSLILILS